MLLLLMGFFLRNAGLLMDPITHVSTMTLSVACKTGIYSQIMLAIFFNTSWGTRICTHTHRQQKNNTHTHANTCIHMYIRLLLLNIDSLSRSAVVLEFWAPPSPGRVTWRPWAASLWACLRSLTLLSIRTLWGHWYVPCYDITIHIVYVMMFYLPVDPADIVMNG